MFAQAVISSIAALKKRPKPDSSSHASVGTEADVQAREETLKRVASLRLSASQLDPYVLSMNDLRKWSYIVDVPSDPGGDRPHDEGSIKTCERCTEKFVVKRREEAERCRFHWGKAFSSRMNGKHAIQCSAMAHLTATTAHRRKAACIHVLFEDTRRRRLRGWPPCLL